MLNLVRYVKTDPATYLIQYRKGKVRRQGSGLSFFYFAPSSTLVSVPLLSVDLPFMFAESTADFQEISLQGVSSRNGKYRTLRAGLPAKGQRRRVRRLRYGEKPLTWRLFRSAV